MIHSGENPMAYQRFDCLTARSGDKKVSKALGSDGGVSLCLLGVPRDAAETEVQCHERTYFCFDVEGASYLLNKEFWEMMNTKEIDDRLVVKDVVMVNIEQFMRLENFFANDRLKLATVINSYIDYKNREELNSVFPFNKFLFQEARKKGYNLKRTKWFDEIYKDLVTMDSHYKLSE